MKNTLKQKLDQIVSSNLPDHIDNSILLDSICKIITKIISWIRNQVLKTIQDENITFIDFWFVDIFGELHKWECQVMQLTKIVLLMALKN